jgi:glycine betaine/choline ABC-type transport system substrate-binding protein
MIAKSFIPAEILLTLRSVFHSKRQLVAIKSHKHYNTVAAVLKGELYQEDVLKTMVDLLREENDNNQLLKLAEELNSIINKRSLHAQAA